MKTKRIMSLILVVVMVSSMGITASAESFSSDYSGGAWSYSKTFASANDTLDSLTTEGFGFEYYKPTVETDHIAFSTVNFSYGKDGADMDFDYGFETYIYKDVNSYPVNFSYSSAGTYTIKVNRDSNVQLTKTVGSTTYVLAQQDVGSNAIDNYVGHTYKVEVTTVEDGVNIKATVKETNYNGAAYDGLEYVFDYTDTTSDKGYDELDNGAAITSGKLYFIGNWTGAIMKYLNVYEILAADSWTYAHTFTDADTEAALNADGYTFSTTPTFAADGMYGNANTTTVTFAPKNASMTDDYSFQTSVYCVTNAHLYAYLRFNQTDAGYYQIRHYRPSTGFADYYVALEKVVGNSTYLLGRIDDVYTTNSGLNWCTYVYDVNVGIGSSSTKITVTVTNSNNKDSGTLEFTDTATDTGADGVDNGAALTSGIIGIENIPSSYKVNYLNLQSTPGVYDVVIPDEPAVDADVMYLTNDRDPYTGALESVESGTSITFDTLYSSVGIDLGEEHSEINNIILTDGDNSNRIHRADLSLYVSDDNVEYTRIKDFTATKVGGKVYLYNFTTNSRFIKVHCHHGVPLQDFMIAESFINIIDDMMSAQNATLPGAGGGEFTKVKELTVTAESDITDGVAFVDNTLLADVSSNPLRFVLDDGYVLSHYTNDEGTYIRIPDVKANTAVNINVYGGNAYAADLSDMNSTFEVTYGNKTAYHLSNGTYFRSNITVAEAPNGDEIIVANDKAQTTLHSARSTNGGRTWSEPVNITTNKISGKNDGGGILVHKERGKMWYFGHFGSLGTIYYTAGIMESNDNGLTWSEPYIVVPNGTGGCVYDNGVIAKSYDGDGPEIDYVFPYNISPNGWESGFYSGVAFSRDNGRNWTTSPVNIGYFPETWEDAHEAGMSEDTIAYLSNGDMTLIARNQWAEENHYAQSVSYDNGYTWVKDAWRSNIWASNGDPNLKNIGDDIVLLWPGNTNANGTAYYRYPLSLAYSTDDMASWNKKLSVWEGTTYGVYGTGLDRSYATQPGFNKVTYKDSDDMFIFWTHHGAGNGVTGEGSIDGILVEDFDEYLHKTKGVADDFESDSAIYENWFQMSASSHPKGYVTISSDKSKTGEKSLKLNGAGSCLMATRSMPQIMDGEIEFDFNLDASNGDLYIPFKAVFNQDSLSGAVYALKIDSSGNLYVLDPDADRTQDVTSVASLGIGSWNNIKIKFDRANDIAKLYVNDAEVADLIISKTMPKIDGVCYVQFITASSSIRITAYVDNFVGYEGVSMTAVAK